MSTLAIVVPGHSRRGRVSRRCLLLVEAAAALAGERGATLAVVSGRGEAEAMRDAWPVGDGLEVVMEPTARTTAENAARTLPLLVERGVTEAIVVCSRTHAPRVRYLFGALYGSYGVACEIRPVGIPPHPGSIVREFGAAVLAPRQRRLASAELETVLRG